MSLWGSTVESVFLSNFRIFKINIRNIQCRRGLSWELLVLDIQLSLLARPDPLGGYFSSSRDMYACLFRLECLR